MYKKILVGLFLVLSLHVAVFATETKQKDDEKIEKVFHKMAKAYKNENMKNFISKVSENRFQKDFVDFFESVKEDFRLHDTMSLDIWIDKITADKKVRFLYVKWDKRYLNAGNNIEQTQNGQSIFVFLKIKNRYKLVDFDGDVLFGNN